MSDEAHAGRWGQSRARGESARAPECTPRACAPASPPAPVPHPLRPTPTPPRPALSSDNLLPYALTGHIHEREVGHHLGMPVAFMPHVAPFFQGISLTVTGHLARGAGGAFPTAAEVRARFAEFYAGERLITVLPEGAMPNVRTHGALSQGVTLGGFNVDAKTGRVALVSCMDNLLKGAATQALQNMNLALGLGEYDGIP